MIMMLTGKCNSSSLFNLSQLRNIHWASFLMGVHGILSKEFLVAVGTGKRAKQKQYVDLCASKRQAFEIKVFKRPSENFMNSSDQIRGYLPISFVAPHVIFEVTFSFEGLAAMIVRAHKRTLLRVHSSMQSQIVRFAKTFVAAWESALEWLQTRVQVFVSHQPISAGKLLPTARVRALVDLSGLGNSSGSLSCFLARILLFFFQGWKTGTDHDLNSHN